MTLNIYQQVFSLSAVANAATTVKDGKNKTQQELQKWLTDALPGKLSAWGVSQWTPVHGPTVWTHDGGLGPDNAWFIVHNPAAEFDDGVHDTYVLAIAATATRYDWVQEDFDVANVVDFAAWMAAGITSPVVRVPQGGVQDGKKPYISIGTARGVYVLLNNPAPVGTAPPGVGKTIVDYLETLPSTARLILTGHSLGSALASTLACALKACGKLDKLERALTYPTAGASPGNTLFAQYFASSFPISPKQTTAKLTYQAWNSNLWNTLDAVPHAWSVTDPNQQLSKIIQIWPMASSALWLIKGMVAVGKLRVSNSNITYTPLQGYSFTGNPPPIEVAKTKAELIKNASQEHVGEYYLFSGLQPPKGISWELEGFGLEMKTEEEVVEDQPFFELLRDARFEVTEGADPGEAEEITSAES